MNIISGKRSPLLHSSTPYPTLSSSLSVSNFSNSPKPPHFPSRYKQGISLIHSRKSSHISLKPSRALLSFSHPALPLALSASPQMKPRLVRKRPPAPIRPFLIKPGLWSLPTPAPVVFSLSGQPVPLQPGFSSALCKPLVKRPGRPAFRSQSINTRASLKWMVAPW
jgi:hypothetical protein